eukprot:6214807-Pleurochrysis_carterae.AAC.6
MKHDLEQVVQLTRCSHNASENHSSLLEPTGPTARLDDVRLPCRWSGAAGHCVRGLGDLEGAEAQEGARDAKHDLSASGNTTVHAVRARFEKEGVAPEECKGREHGTE